jgi:tetratricopeptide (TPR) repeat protein
MILGERLDRAARELEGEAVGDPLVVARLQDRLGRTYRALGRDARAKELFSKSLAVHRARLGPAAPETLAVMSHQALALLNVGEVEESIALHRQAWEAQAQVLGADHRQTLSTGACLAVACWRGGRADEACALLERVRDSLEEHYGPDDDQTLRALYDLSAIYEYIGRGAEAIAMAQRVRDARVKALGADHILAIDSLNHLATRYQAAGKMRQALALFEEARDGIVPRLGPDHPTSLMILDNLAHMYRAFGRTAESVSLGEQVRDARVLSLGRYHPDTIYTVHNLGAAYQAAGESGKALEMYQQAAAGLEKLGFAHPGASQIIWDLCDWLEERGQLDRAAVWRRKWLDAAKKRDGPDSTAYAGKLADLGQDLLLRGRHAVAEPILREALVILEKKRPEGLTTDLVRSAFGSVLLERGQYAEAEPLVLRGYEGIKVGEKRLPPLYARFHVAMAGGRIIRLYEAWGRPDRAAEWRSKLGDLSDAAHGW